MVREDVEETTTLSLQCVCVCVCVCVIVTLFAPEYYYYYYYYYYNNYESAVEDNLYQFFVYFFVSFPSFLRASMWNCVRASTIVKDEIILAFFRHKHGTLQCPRGRGKDGVDEQRSPIAWNSYSYYYICVDKQCNHDFRTRHCWYRTAYISIEYEHHLRAISSIVCVSIRFFFFFIIINYIGAR
jgi:hypothetical protein